MTITCINYAALGMMDSGSLLAVNDATECGCCDYSDVDRNLSCPKWGALRAAPYSPLWSLYPTATTKSPSY